MPPARTQPSGPQALIHCSGRRALSTGYVGFRRSGSIRFLAVSVVAADPTTTWLCVIARRPIDDEGVCAPFWIAGAEQVDSPQGERMPGGDVAQCVAGAGFAAQRRAVHGQAGSLLEVKNLAYCELEGCHVAECVIRSARSVSLADPGTYARSLRLAAS